MRIHRRIPAVIFATALVLASCGGDDDEAAADLGTADVAVEESTVTEEPAAEEPAAEQPAVEQPAAEEPAAEQPAAEEPPAEEPVAEEPAAEEPPAEEPAEPDVVTKGTFDFASGADPQVRVTVAVGPSADGPWEPAGSNGNPTIAAPEYWVQFTIQNRDALGTITDFEISGDEPLGAGLCADVAPVPRSETDSCVVGPFQVEPGGQTVGFTVFASGVLQTNGEGQFIVPPLEPPGYLNAPHSFLFLLDTGAGDSGATLIIGSAAGDTVDVDIPGEVTATISLSCDTPGGGAGVAVFAHSISSYSQDGNVVEQCEDIPVEVREFTLEGLSDVEITYTGE